MNEFYTSAEWKSIRWQCLKRDKFRCLRCGTRGQHGHGLTVHHIVPRDEGGGDHLGNLMTLCPECHDLIEGKDLTNIPLIVGYSDIHEWHKGVYSGGKFHKIDELPNPDLVAWVIRLVKENDILRHENEEYKLRSHEHTTTLTEAKQKISRAKQKISELEMLLSLRGSVARSRKHMDYI